MISEKVKSLAAEVQESLRDRFAEIDSVSENNTLRVMRAFREFRVSDSCFAGTTGYGYDDLGRETLDKIYAKVFGAEAGLVRIGFVNGTHAISSAIFGCVRPGDTVLSISGEPYDTIRTMLGMKGEVFGSLKYYGIEYAQVSLLADGSPDYEGIAEALGNESVSTVLIQRSRGYSTRPSLSISVLERMIKAVKSARPDVKVFVDNCYGEFVEEQEPTMLGADIMAGSLIKNPGGGLAPAGGYIVGTRELVDNAAARMTTPGIGGECGATLGNNRLLLQGFFSAPHVVAQALKTACFCAGMLERLGYEATPLSTEPRTDIIQQVSLGSAENMERFCRGIHSGAPVDAYVTPIPWDMPGYDCPVIMAAGAFIQGASIELSADGPIREPYSVFLQGGLTYESGKLGVMLAISEMLS